MDSPSPDDAVMSRLPSALRWSNTDPGPAMIAGVFFVAGALTLALCSLGWAVALKRDRAAAETARSTQSDMLQILSLERSLEARVAEAAKARDASHAAQLAEVEQRARLEAENEQLRVAIADAEQALQKSRDAVEAFEREQPVSLDTKAELSGLLKNLERNLVAKSDRSDADPELAKNRISSEPDEHPEPDTK